MANKLQTALSFQEVASLIMAGGHDQTIIVEGPFGIGKTAIFNHMRKLAEDPKHMLHNHIFRDPIDCTQLSDGSIWMPDVDKELGVSRELPNERLGVNRKNQKGINTARPVVLCFDELGKAPQYVKNMCAPILYEGRVGDYHLPEGSIKFATTNMAVEGLGDSVQPHLRNRITMVTMRPPTMEEWVNNFAIPNSLHESLIAAVHALPKCLDNFLDYESGGKYAGKDVGKDNGYIFNPKAMNEACTTPRSLHAASKWLKNIDRAGSISDTAMEAALAGTVGSAFAKDMVAFIRYGRDLPDYEEVIKNPMKAPIPKAATAQIVQVFQFVTRVNDRKEADAVTKYVLRMREEMQSLFANSIANANARISLFVGVKEFGELLASNRVFFNSSL